VSRTQNQGQAATLAGSLGFSVEDSTVWLFNKPNRSPASRSADLQFHPQLEGLETRVVPYTTSGNMWPNPQLITVSFVPDGTNLGGQSSNLFSVFNNKFGSASTWENQILKAAQQWAVQTNINFAVIADNGTPEGGGSYQQGDPGMGDIRIGGYNFNCTTLAQAFMPPPINNYSIAGDIAFNTGQPFNIGTTYDLFTVAMHEFGHALGLYHSSSPYAVMFSAYNGARSALTSDDISGIRNIYSYNNPRAPDQYGSLNNSFTTAAGLTSQINTANDTLLVTGDITKTAEKDYYTVTAPAGTGSTVTIDVQSSGLSLLAPTLTIYAADQVTVLGSASGAGHYGTTLTVNLSNATAGQQIYVKVGGADNTALGTGAYALTMSFAGNPLAVVPLPVTQVPNGNPLTAGGGQAQVPGNDEDPYGGDRFHPEGDPQPPAPAVTGIVVIPVQHDLGQRPVDALGSGTTSLATTWVLPAGQLAAVQTASGADQRVWSSHLPEPVTSISGADLLFASDPFDASLTRSNTGLLKDSVSTTLAQPDAGFALPAVEACLGDESGFDVTSDSTLAALLLPEESSSVALKSGSEALALALVLGCSHQERAEERREMKRPIWR
jgi:hypothetical protein